MGFSGKLGKDETGISEPIMIEVIIYYYLKEKREECWVRST